MRRAAQHLDENRDAELFFRDLLGGGVPGTFRAPTRNRYRRGRADRFYESLIGSPESEAVAPWELRESYDEQAPSPPRPYLPAGGRDFVPQPGTFNCAPAGFTVIRGTFLPERTTDSNAALDAALTAAGLNATQRGRVTRTGLLPIAAEFGGAALTELFARLRWSNSDIASWGRGADSMLVPRLLIHIPGHFRELARRAPDAREAFVLECLGWLLMAKMRTAVANATRNSWWIPPPPRFVSAVPDPVPALSAEVSRLVLRLLLIDTTLTADEWNARLVVWGSGPAGRQWQAEIGAPQQGRPFYASLVAVPAHVDTAATRASFATAWTARRSAVDARHTPHAAGATVVTLSGLQNAAALRECENGSPHLPAGAITRLALQGLELTYDFPRTAGRTITELPLLTQLHPIYTALFKAIGDLGWNDLLYQTSGGACFRGIKHPAAARVTIGGTPVTVDPFNNPNATTVTRVNTNFTAAQRGTVIAASRTARTMSEHGLGAAIDFNVPENEQNAGSRPFGSMDPRIVAIFEAFHFRFGACFRPTDPMHFDYSQAPSAPAAATAGTPGPVVTPRMLMPVRATSRVIA